MNEIVRNTERAEAVLPEPDPYIYERFIIVPANEHGNLFCFHIRTVEDEIEAINAMVESRAWAGAGGIYHVVKRSRIATERLELNHGW
jgi:hypothetical protein